MNVIDAGVFIISLCIIISKYLDCKTTSCQITNPDQELNPLARRIFKRFGINTSIWIIFIFTIIIVAVNVWVVFRYYNVNAYKVLFLFTGSLITFFHLAVARTNITKKLNMFTRHLANFYRIWR